MFKKIKKILGWEDPLVKKIEKNWGKRTADFWKISNALFRVSALFTIMGILCIFLGIAILALSQSIQVQNIIFVIPVLMLFLGGIIYLLYLLSIIILAFLFEDYLHAVFLIIAYSDIVVEILLLFGILNQTGSFVETYIIALLVILLYKYWKGRELRKL